MDRIPTRDAMLHAVMKSGCENLRRLDLVHLDRLEMFTKLQAMKCPCLQALLLRTPHSD